MHPMLNIAVRAARAAGNIIAKNLGETHSFDVSEKRKDDLVTSIDKECEKTIVSVLHKAYPDHNIMGEEGGLVHKNENSEFTWIIDPIDGTTNFVKGIPHVAVSIGLMQNNKNMVGVVFNPMTNEMFIASRGDGASLNGRRIRVSDLTSTDGAIIATAPPVRYRERMNAYMGIFHKVVDNCADIRRSGSAALDLCYVAAGRYDAYFEQGLKVWDFCAGELIVREAGGIVTDFVGSPEKNGNIVAGNPKIVQSLIKIFDPNTLDASLR